MGHAVEYRAPEREQAQGGPVEAHRQSGTAGEVSLVPAVADHVAPVHVAGDHGGLAGPVPVRAVPRAVSARQLAGHEQVVVADLACWEGGALDVGDVAEPRALAEEGREKAPGGVLGDVDRPSLESVLRGLVLVGVGNQEVV